MNDTFVYDSGALIAIADQRNPERIADHLRLLGLGRVLVPAVVAAQVVRNPATQSRLMRALRGCDIVPFTAGDHVPVGQLLAASRTADVVDAFVALLAHRANASILSGDPDDIRHLLGCIGTRRRVFEV